MQGLVAHSLQPLKNSLNSLCIAEWVRSLTYSLRPSETPARAAFSLYLALMS